MSLAITINEPRVLEAIERVSRLAGVTVAQTVNVVLALWIVERQLDVADEPIVLKKRTRHARGRRP